MTLFFDCHYLLKTSNIHFFRLWINAGAGPILDFRRLQPETPF